MWLPFNSAVMRRNYFHPYQFSHFLLCVINAFEIVDVFGLLILLVDRNKLTL